MSGVDPKLLAHHPLGASGASRWMKCPASIKASEGLSEPVGYAAAEGTVAHHIAEQCLLAPRTGCHLVSVFEPGGPDDPAQYLGRTFTQEGHEVVVDQEMVESLRWYIGEVRDRALNVTGDLLVEQRIYLDPWIKGGFGTADAVAIGTDGICFVGDLKYGRFPVTIDGPQLRIYALGVLHTFGMLYDIDTFQIAILQPRLNSVSETTIRAKDLVAWGSDVLRPAALATEDGDAAFVPGEHCKFCKARNICTARRDHVLAEVFDDEFTAIVADEDHPATLRDPLSFSDNELTRVLPILDQITAWCRDVKTHATRQLASGHKVGDWKLVEGRTTRTWADEDRVVELLKKTKGVRVADLYEKKLISVAKAEKLVGKDHPALSLVNKPQGKPKLAPGSDPKPAMTVDASNDFNDMPEWEE